jgi:hypothetical protein
MEVKGAIGFQKALKHAMGKCFRKVRVRRCELLGVKE